MASTVENIVESSDWTIEFAMDDTGEQVRQYIEEDLLIGRSDPSQMVFDGLDLTPYGGGELGVSRQHATIRWQGDDLVICDLHSSNGTILNSRRLQPGVEQRLNDGDHVIIGHLKMTLRINDDLGWSTVRGRRTEFSLRKLPIKGRGQRILVIEDDPSYSALYRAKFEQAGYTVQVCHEAVAAMRLLNSGSFPALILLDLRLPGVHGLELCRYVRRDTDNPAVPIVVVSAADGDTVPQALDAGADIYLGKPFNIKELSRIVVALIHKNETEHPSLGTKKLAKTAVLENLPLVPGKGSLVIFIDGHRDPIGVTIESQAILGRRLLTPVGRAQTFIDLEPFGAFDKGVSRAHARITLQNDSFLLEDLESSNGTFLNGKSLRPHQPTLIGNGDEVRLGELRMGVYLVGNKHVETNMSAGQAAANS